VDISAGDYLVRAQGTVLRFEGFQKVWGRDAEKDDERSLPPVAEGQALTLREVTAEQRFTQPPPRYTEASLIKELEERGIGRPSTYATILDTIQDRDYVRQVERRLQPTPLGETVTGLLIDLFPELLDVGFTAQMEGALDDVESGRRQWVPLLHDFYGPFSGTLNKAQQDLKRLKVPPQATDEICPQCGKPLVIRQGRYGEFTACSGYPECTYVKREAAAQPVPTGVACVEPDCGGQIMERRSRRGKTFFGCSNYPKCRAVFWHRPTGQPCPTCGKPLVVRTSRRGETIFCSDPECPSREGESSRRRHATGERPSTRRRALGRRPAAPRRVRAMPSAAAEKAAVPDARAG
jgi:DNA topoisomerase-1